VWNEEVAALTGLSSLSDIICRRRSAIFGHIARFGEEVPAQRRSATASAYLLDVYRTFPGGAVLVVHVAGGSTSSEEITVSHPPTYGDRLSTAVTVEE